MKFAALGRHEILYKSIQQCVKSGHEPVLIGTCPAAPEYRVRESDFARLSAELGCQYFCDTSINQTKYIELFQNCGVDVAISFNWLTIINQGVIDAFKFGIINAHPGDLPRYRGNACPNWAMLFGEPFITISLHNMSSDLDSGPILLKKQMPITAGTYIGEIYGFLEDTIPLMFSEVLNGLEKEHIKTTVQPNDPNSSLRVFPRLPVDSQIDWALSAQNLSRLVHASAEPFAGAYSYIGVEKVVIWQAHAEQLPYPNVGSPGQVAEVRRGKGEVAILTGDGILVLEEIEINNRRAKASDLIRSARTRLGMDVTNEITRLEERLNQLEDLAQSLSTKINQSVD